jgi:hypothetical protein
MALHAEVCNPLLRTPLSLIIDDSCPVVNLTYFWIKERHAWRARHEPGTTPDRWEGDLSRVKAVTIPAEFARKWGEWCGEQGIRGKFSLVPYPAGVGRVDTGFPDFPRRDLEDWLAVYRDVIHPNFDITPEMLTHTHVVDLQTWGPTEEWEQREWVEPPDDLERLTDYIAAAMQLLKNAGFACEGVTSPGAFGKRREELYARATLEASLRVNGNPRPFYFLWLIHEGLPDVPIRFARPDEGVAIASIVSCAGDWFGGWTGYDRGSADRFITADLQGGRCVEVLQAERPCILVGHWGGFYFEGTEDGFDILKEVKRRLDAYDPDGTKTIWMKNSEIGHYWMAREFATLTTGDSGVTIRTQYPTANFTMRLDTTGRCVTVNGADLRPVTSRRDFRGGTCLVEGNRTFAAFDLEAGATELAVS